MSDDDPFAGLAPVGAEEPAPADDRFTPLLDEGAKCELNDDGNGRRFVIYFGDDLMWVPRVGWHVWTGKVWALDPDQIEVRRRAQAVGGLVARECHVLELSNWQAHLVAQEAGLRRDMRACAADDAGMLAKLNRELTAVRKALKDAGDPRLAHHRFAVQCGNSARMESMRSEAGVRLAVPLEQLDAEPLDVNCASGVLRFRVDVVEGVRYAEIEHLPHGDSGANRDRLMTKIMPVHYDPDIADGCPRFDAFLARILPDAAVRDFVMRWFALSMTGLIEQHLVYLYGQGANGKSVLVDLMARLMGDYAATAKIESLTGTNRRGGGDATPDLVPLIGARMVRAAEPDEGMRWQEGLIKDLTGGEPILVRALHSDFVEVRPVFCLTISGNHKPLIHGTDDGIWRRLLMVPFDVQIPDAEKIPKAEMDAMLFAERDAIFRRLTGALCEYLERGLRPPAQVVEATTEYRMESDPFGAFLSECCVISGDPADSIEKRELTLAFGFWMLLGGRGTYKDGTVTRKLGDKARTHVCPRTRQRFSERKSNGRRFYDGIRLTDVFRREWDAAPKDHHGRALSARAGGDDRQAGAEDF